MQVVMSYSFEENVSLIGYPTWQSSSTILFWLNCTSKQRVSYVALEDSWGSGSVWLN